MTRMAFTVGRFEAPSEISIANIDGSGERQLTHIHDPFRSEVALSRSERLNFKSADGTPVEGGCSVRSATAPGTGRTRSS